MTLKADLSQSDQNRLFEILGQGFGFAGERWGQWAALLGQENLFGWYDGSHLVGGLGVYPMGQWFGGSAVGLVGIAGVGLAPAVRSRGAAKRMLQQTLKELRQRGYALAGLYPATQNVYRHVGFEQAGEYVVQSAPFAHFRPRAAYDGEVTEVNTTNHAVFHDLYRRQAKQQSGMLERGDAIWRRVVQPEGDNPVYGALFGPAHSPEGYVIYSQKRHDDGFDMLIRDYGITTPQAARGLLQYVSGFFSIGTRLTWKAPTRGGLNTLIREQAKVVTDFRWMLRVLDPEKAFSERGYNPTVAGAVSFQYTDDLFPEVSGSYQLQVKGGHGLLERIDTSPSLQLTPRSLAALFSGYLSASDLMLMEVATGSGDEILQFTQITHNPEGVWCPDFF